jgi:hypothetical protein
MCECRPVLFNPGQIREQYVTVDYSDEDSRPLRLLRIKPQPKPRLLLPEFEYVDPRAAKRRSARVPRMSMLLEFEREHAKRFALLRRKAALAMSVAFLLGMTAGIAGQTTSLKHLASGARAHLATWVHAAAR